MSNLQNSMHRVGIIFALLAAWFAGIAYYTAALQYEVGPLLFTLSTPFLVLAFVCYDFLRIEYGSQTALATSFLSASSSIFLLPADAHDNIRLLLAVVISPPFAIIVGNIVRNYTIKSPLWESALITNILGGVSISVFFFTLGGNPDPVTSIVSAITVKLLLLVFSMPLLYGLLVVADKNLKKAFP